MNRSKEPRTRVALVDLELSDCDRLRDTLGRRIQVSLVIAPSEASPLARWAELGGYPWATDLDALTAVVADTVAVAAGSPRRADAMALAGALGARPALFGEKPASAKLDEISTQPGAAPIEIDQALAALFEAPPASAGAPELWKQARGAGFSAGAYFAAQGELPEGVITSQFGEPDALALLEVTARQATRSKDGWVALSLLESGYWKAWCGLASSQSDGGVVALGGRLLPSHGYGAPNGDTAEQRADRKIAEGLLEQDWLVRETDRP